MASGKKNYFRHSFFARNDEIILGLIDKFGYKGYFFWFALLEICGEQAADEYPDFFKFHESRLLRELRCNKRSLHPVLEYLQSRCKLDYNYTEKFYEIRIANFSKWLGKYQSKLPPNSTKERKEKERKENKNKKREIPVADATDRVQKSGGVKTTKPKINFSFEEIYNAFPRKKGKSAGIAKCKAKIKTEKQFGQLMQAVKNYAEECQVNQTETKYIKHFSTFMTNWEDYLEMEQVKTREQLEAEEFERVMNTFAEGEDE